MARSNIWSILCSFNFFIICTVTQNLSHFTPGSAHFYHILLNFLHKYVIINRNIKHIDKKYLILNYNRPIYEHIYQNCAQHILSQLLLTEHIFLICCITRLTDCFVLYTLVKFIVFILLMINIIVSQKPETDYNIVTMKWIWYPIQMKISKTIQIWYYNEPMSVRFGITPSMRLHLKTERLLK